MSGHWWLLREAGAVRAEAKITRTYGRGWCGCSRDRHYTCPLAGKEGESYCTTLGPQQLVTACFWDRWEGWRLRAGPEETSEGKHNEESSGSFYRENCREMWEKEGQRTRRKGQGQAGGGGWGWSTRTLKMARNCDLKSCREVVGETVPFEFPSVGILFLRCSLRFFTLN